MTIIDYWTVPELLRRRIRKELNAAGDDGVEFIDGVDYIHSIEDLDPADPPAWYYRHCGYGDGDSYEKVREATMEEAAEVYRATALRLYQEERKNAHATTVGEAVLRAVRTGTIRVRP